MLVYPNAKINIGLDIVARRTDGYHDIETLFMPIPELTDILEIVFAPEAKMVQYGLEYDGEPEDNLCFKAFRLLQKEKGIGNVEIHLYKKIPVGAGFGGGSADCAFTLMTLNDLFGLGLSKEDLAGYAATLGSDCPFFIYNRPMLASGRGEILKPYDLDLGGYRIELAMPDIHVSTREAYSKVTPARPGTSLAERLAQPIGRWKGCVKNDFEPSVFAAHPSLAAIKDDFYRRGAVYASLSGSGAALYGIFSK